MTDDLQINGLLQNSISSITPQNDAITERVMSAMGKVVLHAALNKTGVTLWNSKA